MSFVLVRYTKEIIFLMRCNSFFYLKSKKVKSVRFCNYLQTIQSFGVLCMAGPGDKLHNICSCMS